MRILTVCSSWRVFGAEVMSLNLLAAFRKHGHEQLAITSTWSDGEFSRRLRELQIDEVALPLGGFSKTLSWEATRWNLNGIVNAPTLWSRFHGAVSRFRPNVLVLTSPKQGLWLYPWLARQPTFLLEHSSKGLSGANRWMYRKLNQKLVGFLAASRFMGGHLRQLGVPDDKITVVYNCVEVPPENDVGASNRWPSSVCRIGIIGQISPHKGHDALLAATDLLERAGFNFEVHVFGSGEPNYIAALRTKTDAMVGRARWHWKGYTGDKQSIYRSIDICVMPSLFEEPFGMVALEASAFGLAVIASRRGGLPEIVQDGVTGLLIEPTQPDDIADKVALLLRQPELAADLGRRGRERVQHKFSEFRMVREFEAAFASARGDGANR